MVVVALIAAIVLCGSAATAVYYATTDRSPRQSIESAKPTSPAPHKTTPAVPTTPAPKPAEPLVLAISVDGLNPEALIRLGSPAHRTSIG